MSSSDTIDYNKLYSLAESCNTGEFISNLTGQLGKQGFDINKQIHGSGRTLLHITAKNGCTDIVNALLEDKRIDIDAKDNNGRTPLHLAAKTGFATVVNALLKKGASVRGKDNNGDTPLHLAARHYIDDEHRFITDYIEHYSYTSIVKALLDKRARVDIKNNEGKTPLDLAVDERAKNLLQKKQSIDNGNDAREQNDEGEEGVPISADESNGEYDSDPAGSEDKKETSTSIGESHGVGTIRAADHAGPIAPTQEDNEEASTGKSHGTRAAEHAGPIAPTQEGNEEASTGESHGVRIIRSVDHGEPIASTQTEE